MKNTYTTFVRTGVLHGWLRIRTFDHGHTGAVFEVRKAFSLLKGVLKVFRGEESARRIRAFYAEAKFMLSDALEGYKPKCLDGVATKDEMWFVMQRVGHMPKKLPPKLLVKHLSRIATALAMMHAMKLIHGDVKRENLGIYKGLAILLDYGCMQTFKQAEEDPTFNGTWDFMPDEVRKKKSIDYRADIYALGMTLKELCPRPYRGIFQPVIERATAKKPEDRYQSMDEFRIALENCEKEFMHVMALASRLPKFKRVAGVTGITVGVATVVVILIMAVVGSCTVNRALSQNGELRKEAYRKAAVYERKAGKASAFKHSFNHFQMVFVNDVGCNYHFPALALVHERDEQLFIGRP